MSRPVEQNAADSSPLAGQRDNIILASVFVVLALVALISYAYHQIRFTLEQRQAACHQRLGDRGGILQPVDHQNGDHGRLAHQGIDIGHRALPQQEYGAPPA